MLSSSLIPKKHLLTSWLIYGSACMITLTAHAAHENNDNQNSKLQGGLELKQAIIAAQSQDPWLSGSAHNESSLLDLSKVEGSLPDPQISIGLANLAVDSLDFNQEGMTQLRIGASQMFPRGDTLKLRQKKLVQKAAIHPLERLDRRAKVGIIVTDLWLDAYTAQESIKLIESKRELFEQLSQIAETNYANAIGKVRQHNIIRAQLELTQLEDRLLQLKRKRDIALEGLARWVGNAFQQKYTKSNAKHTNSQSNPSLKNKNILDISVTDASQSSKQSVKREPVYNEPVYNEPVKRVYANLPAILPLKAAPNSENTDVDNQLIFEQVQNHPAIIKFDQQLAIAKTDIALQKQRNKTQWGISSAYGYRADAANGDNRSDLISVGVMFDVPLFSNDVQSSAISSAKSGQESLKTAKWEFVREFIGQFRSVQASLKRVEERQRLFNTILLPQMHDQADASLSAYTNDDGDFSEVVRARIAELNASINALSIDTEKQKLIMKLNYFLMSHPNILVDQITQTGTK
jgi:hypothetical protein